MDDLTSIAVAVTSEFGDVWKASTEAELCDFVERHAPVLPALLLFEVAHEGRPIPAMVRAAELAGLQRELGAWSQRLC